MLKKEEGMTLAMLSLFVVILLMIIFTTILLVFDSGIITINNTENINQNNYSENETNVQQITQEINSVENNKAN